MIQSERDRLILSTLAERGVASVRDLQQRIGRVSEITIRRDLARLEQAGRLDRTRGGAVAKAPATPHGGMDNGAVDDVDVLVLPPLSSRWSRTLRHNALQRGHKLIAESAPQDGALYVGPNNLAAGRALGEQAGRDWRDRCGDRPAHLLLVEQKGLSNTRERARGFEEGFARASGREPIVHAVDGGGLFSTAYRAALDALEAYPDIGVLFGVNDHSILAALEAAGSLGRGAEAVSGYSVGVEGNVVLDLLVQDGALRASAALFPDLVGRLTVDAAACLLQGQAVAAPVETPWSILTAANLEAVYERGNGGWQLRPDRAEALTTGYRRPQAACRGGTIGFVLHYPAHDWYRKLSAAMRARAGELGLAFVARNPEDQYAAEIADVRGRIAACAVDHVGDGETLFLDAGPFADMLIDGLSRRRNLTVITPSIDAFQSLTRTGGHRAILTGGEMVGATGRLGGATAFASLDGFRADRAVIAADAVDTAFGVSCLDERHAALLRRMADSARETVLLADHSQVGGEARARACTLATVDTLITDSGTLPIHRADLAKAGIRVIVAEDHPTTRATAA